MKKSISIFITICFLTMLLFTGCGDVKEIDGVTYDTYGLFNQGSMKNENIEYRTIVGNVVWGILLFETIAAPIYFFGFSMYEPIGKLDKDKEKGSI